MARAAVRRVDEERPQVSGRKSLPSAEQAEVHRRRQPAEAERLERQCHPATEAQAHPGRQDRPEEEVRRAFPAA